MVWFQCEDCGENLKKPKLAIHFNRCSAYKLSCIDCGVVFDQQSVQAHSSCVSEAEKYGPKGVNKGAAGPASKPKNGKGQNGLDVDFSRGLSTCAPWSCSLCNIKATSQETLEIHAVGKKHQSRCKAAAAKDKGKTQGGDTSAAPTNLDVGGGKKDDQEFQIEADVQQATAAASDAASLSPEKKRKKERIGEGDDDLTSLPSGNVEKRLKRGGTSVVVATSATEKEDERLPESSAGKDSQDRKRKLVEEQEEIVLEENGQGSGSKKSRKKGKQAAAAPGEVNGHGDDRMDAPKVSGSSGNFGNDENGQQVKRKEKKGSQKDVLVSPLGNGSLGDSREQIQGVEEAGGVELGSQSDGKNVIAKRTKKSKDLAETSRKVKHDETSKHSKKERKKVIEQKEAIVHEISFREWLGEEDGTQDGTPTHPPHDIHKRMKESLEQLEGAEKAKSGTDLTQDGIAKVVKWKKIIREVLGKLVQSLNGKLKKIELKKAVLPLAQKAIDSASISVDRKALRAELMRQVNSSPKFVVDGKHVMLAPKV